MSLHTLEKSTTKRKKRLGQGHGSGRVKTSGRGTKGQKARTKIPMSFEGGALPLKKRMPFLRGKSRNKAIVAKPVILNLDVLQSFPAKSVVDMAFLIKKGLLSEKAAKVRGVKLLGNGELTIALTVKLPVSKSAREKIEKAKGTVEA